MKPRIFPALAFVTALVLFCAGNAWAQAAGAVTADPNPCTIAETASACDITVSWTASGASSAKVTLQDGDGPEDDFATGLVGSKVLTAQAPPHQYTVRLYATGGTTLKWLDATVVLAIGTGTLTADPDPCIVAGGDTTCSTTLTWNTTNVGHALVTMRDAAGGGESNVSNLLSGSQAVSLVLSHDYIFTLYDTSSSDLYEITETEVRVINSRGGISANPDPCPIPTGAQACTTTVGWDTQNVTSPLVTMADSETPLVPPKVIGTSVSGSYEAAIEAWPHQYSFILYDASYGTPVWLDETAVIASGTGIITVSPDPCSIPSGSSLCNVSVNWSTDNVAAAEVTQQDLSTTEEISLEKAKFGSKPLALSGPKSYMFRLYDITSGTRIFLDAYEISVAGAGSISASPDPCVIETGAGSCTTTVTWSTSGVTQAEVTQEDTYAGGEVTISNELSYSLAVPIEASPHDYFFTLYDISTGLRIYLDSWEVTAVSAPNGTPSNLTATLGTVNSGRKTTTVVNLAWTDNSSNETRFSIQRCVGATCTNFANLATVNANVTGYTDKSISRNTTYRYRVRAYNSNGYSPYSNIASVTTPRR